MTLCEARLFEAADSSHRARRLTPRPCPSAPGNASGAIGSCVGQPTRGRGVLCLHPVFPRRRRFPRTSRVFSTRLFFVERATYAYCLRKFCYNVNNFLKEKLQFAERLRSLRDQKGLS